MRFWFWLGACVAGDPDPVDPSDTPVESDLPVETDLPTVDTAEERTPRPDVSYAESDAVGAALRVSAGSFLMGCEAPRDDLGSGCFIGETPTRQVTLTRDLWVMEAEVTQRQWAAFGFINPSAFRTAARPVDSVSWWDAVAAANRASEIDGLEVCYALDGCTDVAVGQGRVCETLTVQTLSGSPYDCVGWRLPTEAEWEWIARAGQATAFPGGDDPEPLAWFDANSGLRTWPGCLRERNGVGLCDLAGNLTEWTSDWQREFREGDVTDPFTPESGGATPDRSRAFRGGFWGARPDFMRIAYRSGENAHRQRSYQGFRLVRTAE